MMSPFLVSLLCICAATETPHRGMFEVHLKADAQIANPYLDPGLKVTFKRPDASVVTVDAFYDGIADGKQVFKARAYCDQTGKWSWTSSSNALNSQRGKFKVVHSELPGKLRKHPQDPHQLAYDNGQWFLHVGDTGYRYVVDTEPEWQVYIDQSVKMGATKIRTWFCRSRSNVEALFSQDRSALDLPYWQEIDRRVRYAMDKYPALMLQLIPYGEDGEEVIRYAQGDPMARLVAQYAQARFSAYPNVIWCISNDQILEPDAGKDGGRHVPASAIDAIGRDMAGREPWGTLLTNHQARYSGYAFPTAPWSDIVTLEDLDQVHGKILLEYRQKTDDPVVNEEDRYDIHEHPEHPRYYFRRLMWASLLSGGAATYGGSKSYEPYNGHETGVRGYYDLNKEGILRGGADDFKNIHKFFKDSGLTLVGMKPADDIVDGAAKAAAGDRAIIAYVPNPDSDKPGEADANPAKALCQLRLPRGNWSLRWFNPHTGEWHEYESATAPFSGDAILLATR